MATVTSNAASAAPLSASRRTRSARLIAWLRDVAAAPVLSGVLLTLAFPPLGWWWAAWAALVPLYVVLAHGRAGFLRGLLFGLALFLVGMVWMIQIGVVPWLVLSLIQAGWFALFGAVAALLLPRLPAAARPWTFAALWVLSEALRTWGRLAFPWFPLAVTQVRALPVVQIVAVTGQWGLAFAVVLANGWLGEAWLARRRTGWTALGFVGAGLALLAALWAGGSVALGRNTVKDESERGFPVRQVAVVQGSVTPLSNATRDEQRAHFLRSYLDLTREALQDKQMALVTWPETAIPGTLLGMDPLMRRAVGDLARSAETPLLAGTVDLDAQRRRSYNGAVLFDGQGTIRARYHKTQLVPYGEFFPLREFLGPILTAYGAPDQDFRHGTLPGVLTTRAVDAPTALGALICYESIFGRIARARVRDGAQVLVLLTSDQTFGKTPGGPYQHLDFSTLRAVETRRYLVRTAATGVSQILDPCGRVKEQLGMNRPGTLTGAVALRDDQTPFVRWGDWFLSVCGALAVGAVGLAAGRGRRL